MGLTLVFLTRSLDSGGAERQLVTLSKGLHAQGYAIVVVVFYPGGSLEKELREAGVTVRVVDKRGRWDVCGFVLRLVRLLHQERPDILHSYLVVPNLLTVMLKPLFLHTKVVWGIRASNVDLSRYDWFVRLTFKVSCWLARFTDLIIVNSQSGWDYHLACGFPREKMVVISNGIDTGRFKPDPEARQRMRTAWGIKGHEKLIGLVGRLDPMKDHPTFLQAAALVAREREDVVFVCVGDGPANYRQELQELSEELGVGKCLNWVGKLDDMPAVYNALDIATSSSSYGEGFPNVIGEAMACGVPCVVTNVGDAAYIVGKTGVVVPPKNPRALAEGWKACLACDRDVRVWSAQSRIEENFSVQRLIEQTEKALWHKA